MSRDKIKFWYYHFFSIKKFLKLTIKQFYIYRSQPLKVIIAILIFRSLFTFFKIIVHCNWIRAQSIRPELYRQTMRKRCLTGGRRPRDQYKPNIRTYSDLFRNLRYFFFLKRFLYQYQFIHITSGNFIVQITYRFYSLSISPFR